MAVFPVANLVGLFWIARGETRFTGVSFLRYEGDVGQTYDVPYP
jgi:hypothetical protein